MQHRKKRGLTLLEVTIASSLLAMVAGAIVMFVEAGSRTYRATASSAEMNALALAALDEVSERLRTTSPGRLSPPPLDPPPDPPVHTSQIDFERAIGFTAGEVQWGEPERLAFRYSPSDPDDGIDNDGNGLVDEGELVWLANPGEPDERSRVLTRWVRETLEGEIPGNGMDDNGNELVDEPGLAFTCEGDRIVVYLSLERIDGRRSRLSRTVTRTIALRNYDDE